MVVDGVARLLVDIDAAGEVLIALACKILQLLRSDGAVDAGDEHALGLALGEQLHCPVDAGDTSGQHGNTVGLLVRRVLVAFDAVGEDNKADDQHHQQQDQKIEDEADAAQEAAEAPEALRSLFLFLPHHLLPTLLKRRRE